MKRLEKSKKSKLKVLDIYENKYNKYIIHYSCGDIYKNNNEETARITSIAIKCLLTGQIKSFSIHKTAEIQKIKFSQIEENYDGIEKEMLRQFFLYCKRNKNYYWIHWGMKSSVYGFEALYHRANILGLKNIFNIIDDHKIDLSNELLNIYGENYINHPRLSSLLELNKIIPKNFMSGKDESKSFEKKEFIKIHSSTISKVEALNHIIILVAESKLKTQANKLKDIFGFTFQGVYDFFKDKWYISLLSFFIPYYDKIIIYIKEIFKHLSLFTK